MDSLHNLIMGFAVALSPMNVLMCLVGVVIGTVIGALPGIGPSAGTAILLPLTFTMNPTTAIIMLAGIYYGAMYGGTITSVLLHTPGESASVMTAVDGYQMALQGRAGKALGIAAVGSFIAGTLGTLAFTFLGPLLAGFALSFGPPEYFALMVLGLSTLSGLAGESALKGLSCVLFGLLLGCVGIDVISGLPRFTFGHPELTAGLEFLPVAMGLFGIAEILSSLEGEESTLHVDRRQLGWRSILPDWTDWVASRLAILRGTVIGFIVGTLPGAGATIASFISYAVEKQASRHPERFGRGAIEGVAGPESANNSAAVGAMVPLLTLGVPGSATTAVLMGALMLWGLRPGPLLFVENPDFVWGLMASMYIGNVMLLLLNLLFVPLFVRVAAIPRAIMAPFVIVLCVVGVYSLNNSLFDVWIMLAFGLLGYLMQRLGFPAPPVVLSLVLGPLLEAALRQSLILSEGSMRIFVVRPISAVLLAAALVVLLLPVLRWGWRALVGGRHQAPPGEAAGNV